MIHDEYLHLPLLRLQFQIELLLEGREQARAVRIVSGLGTSRWQLVAALP